MGRCGLQKLTFSQAERFFFLDKNLRQTTIDQYKYFYRLFSEYLGVDQPVDAITAQQVKRFFKWLAHDRELSAKTVVLAHCALSSLWTWATDELGCENILKGIKRPAFHEKPITIYTADEVKRLLQAANHTSYERADRTIRARRHTALRDIAIIFTLLDTGIRATELCNLTLADYDQSTGRLMICAGKGGRDRPVYAGKRTQRAIMRYQITRDGKPTDPLFAAGDFDDSHLDRANLLKLLKRLGDTAGVSGVFVHRQRRAFQQAMSQRHRRLRKRNHFRKWGLLPDALVCYSRFIR